jgi:lysophospholipase L1-like esterase
LAPVVAFAVAAMAILAAVQPGPAADPVIPAAVAATRPSVANPPPLDVSTRADERGTVVMFDRRPQAAPSGRPVIKVPPPTPKAVPRAAGGRTAVFLGDSYTTGWNGAGIGSRGWPKIVAHSLGWRTVNLAVAGTGFMNPGWTKQPLGSRVDDAIRLRPDVVVVASGHNDSRWSTTATDRAADKAIERLRQALPDARMIIIGPIWPSGRPPARCLDLRDHLRRTAASIGATFIDPLGEGWFAGGYRRLIGADGIHPTNAGHRRIADRVLADLALAGR